MLFLMALLILLMKIDAAGTTSFQQLIFFCLVGGFAWIVIVEEFVVPVREGMHEAEQEYRTRRGQCVNCGYSLRGNTSGVCPECGNAHGDSHAKTLS